MRAIFALIVAAVIGAAAIAAVTREPAAPARGEGEATPGNAIVAPRDRGTAAFPPLRALPRRNSRPIGIPSAGRLEGGVQMPVAGPHHFTWDPIRRQAPNRPWRRWGAYQVVRLTLKVVREYRAAHPGAPRVGIGDLSRPEGGDFGPRYGLPGHASHQNGLDVDLYYPRLDRKELSPKTVEEIDLPLSQDLVDRFVDAGAEVVFVGPNTGLEGPPGIVVPLVNHDNHVHVRLPG
jgi:murein endopeptidase